MLAKPRCRGTDLGLRPLEPSGDFLRRGARFFEGGCHHTHVCDDCDRERRVVGSHLGRNRALDVLVAFVRILHKEHQLPEESVFVHERHTRCGGCTCETCDACPRVPRENPTGSDHCTPHASE